MDSKQIEKEISELYQDILLRTLDQQGLNHWTEKIIHESYKIEDVRRELQKSIEYKRLNESKQELPQFECKINDSIKNIIGKTSWYHYFNFNGVHNKNTRTTPSEQLWITQHLPKSFHGKSVLDIGCADGFFGFLSAHKGAQKVVCGDFMKYEGFQAAEKIINLDVEHRIINLCDFKETERFDYVFCFGLYYHLPDIVQSMKYLQSITKDAMYVAGPISNETEPMMYYYEPYELYSTDDSNWWVASPTCLTGIAKRVGFKAAELLGERSAEHWAIPLDDKKSKRKVNKYGIFKFSK